MRIVFGQRNFKIREFRPHELGFISDTHLNFNIEVRQNYFHIYWIPFFGTGKIWGIRRDGELYELPLEYRYHIKNSNIKVRSPWYTYTLLIMIALGFLIYTSVEKVKEYDRGQQEEVYFAKSVLAFDARIDQAKANQFYVLENIKENDEKSKMYLKVEKVTADKISFSIIPGFFLEASGLKIEDCYTQNKGQLETITILKSELKNAFARDFEVSQQRAFKGLDLLKSKQLYSITAIEDGFSTKLEAVLSFKDYEVIQIQMKSTGTAFTIVSIKNIENNIPWDIKLPLKIEAATESNPQVFFLSSKKQADFTFYSNNIYKVIITLKDEFGIQHTYDLSGHDDYCSTTKIN